MRTYIPKADRVPPGPLARHGGYSVTHKDKIIRWHQGIQLYLKVVRKGLIRDLSPEGEDHMTTARHIILDRLMQKLATSRLIEHHLAEHPEEILAAASVTGLWMSINNAILKDLLALGLERKALDAIVLSGDALIDAVEEERAAARAKALPVEGGGDDPAKSS